jgi:hypothetical protein
MRTSLRIGPRLVLSILFHLLVAGRYVSQAVASSDISAVCCTANILRVYVYICVNRRNIECLQLHGSNNKRKKRKKKARSSRNVS